MNHSFNVEVAEKYGIEKAILLENFYFWCKKNKANKKNIHNGKAYTYNTSEAFAELFPYMKARKIAQLLREMEFEDNLLISGQFGVDGNKHDRTKFYTLSDNALSFFEQCNIQNYDNGTSENCIIENTKNGDCIYTDINTDVNTNVNTDTIQSNDEENPTSSTKYEFKTKDGIYTLSLTDYNVFKEGYKNIEVDKELEKMVMWCYSNERKRKTKKGMKKFINNWLSRVVPTSSPTEHYEETEEQKYFKTLINNGVENEKVII